MAISLIERRAGVAEYTDERVTQPDVQALLTRVTVIEPDAFSALVRTDLAKWGKVVRDSSAKVE